MSVSLKYLTKFFSVLIVVAGVSDLGFAQVVTPSFDPTQPVVMPSASGWRESSSASGSYREGSGARRLLGTQKYQFESSGYDAAVTYHTGNFYLEGALSQLSTTRKGAIDSEGLINYEKSSNQFSATLVGNDFVTIGLGTKSDISLDYHDATDDSVTTTQAKTIGSISVKPMNWFLFGLGFERVKETRSNGKGVNWNNVLAGIAVNAGTEGGTKFRTEYSLGSSAREENFTPGDPNPGVHPKTTSSLLSLEVLFSGLLFTISEESKTIDLGPTNTENGVTVSQEREFISRKGVMWIPQQGGLSLGFYFIDYGRVASYRDGNSMFQINLGYLF